MPRHPRRHSGRGGGRGLPYMFGRYGKRVATGDSRKRGGKVRSPFLWAFHYRHSVRRVKLPWREGHSLKGCSAFCPQGGRLFSFMGSLCPLHFPINASGSTLLFLRPASSLSTVGVSRGKISTGQRRQASKPERRQGKAVVPSCFSVILPRAPTAVPLFAVILYRAAL